MKFFTVAEIKRRLRATKEYLMKYSNQRTKFLCSQNLPRLELLRYDAEDEMNFICASELKEDELKKVVRDNQSLFVDEGNYKHMSLSDYVDSHRAQLQQLFTFTCFCLCDTKGKVLFKVVVCLGSLHHAPRILYRNEITKKTFYEKLIAYDDLQ